MENKAMTLNKKVRVEVPIEHQYDGIVAFQMVEFIFNYFGNEVKTLLDTKILEDGRQFVISGDGFIKEGYQIA